MEVSVEATEGLGRLVRVEVPESVISGEVEDKLRKLMRTVNIPGFRRGKVPLKVIRHRLGHNARQNVLSDTLESSLKTALSDHDLRPASTPQIDILEDKSGFCYTAELEVLPEIDLTPINGVPIKLPQSSVEESDIDNMIGTLRARQARFEAVERAAKDGDQVHLTVTRSEAANDAPSLEGTVGFLGVHSGQTSSFLGSEVCPPLEEALDGALVGDQRTIELYSELTDGGEPQEPEKQESDADSPSAGKALQPFIFHVDNIKEAVLPQVDADFITAFGVEEGTLDAFRVALREHIERQLAKRLADVTKEQVTEALAKALTFDIPDALLKYKENDISTTVSKAWGGDKKLTENDYADVESLARRLVVRDLITDAILKAADIHLDAQRLRETIAAAAAVYEDPQVAARGIYNTREKHEDFRLQMLETQVIEWVIERAEVTRVTLSLSELTGPNPLAESPDEGAETTTSNEAAKDSAPGEAAAAAAASKPSP